jgi:anti-sigma-K factor RskA
MSELGYDETSHARFAELAAGFAVHALAAADEQEFSAHLVDCERCRRTVHDLREAMAEVALSAPVAPPPELRGAILHAIGAEEEVPATAHQVAPPGRHRWLSTQIFAAAAAGVAVLSLLSWNLSLRHDTDQAQAALARTQEVLSCAAESDCHPVALKGAAGTASAFALVRDGHVRLVLSGVSANNRQREVYVLWEQLPGGAMSALGTFDVGTLGVTAVDAGELRTPFTRSTVLAVSREAGRTAPASPSAPLLLS